MSLVELGRFETRVQADLARLLLESYGISSILFDADVHTYIGVGSIMPVRLMALDEDRLDALAILTAGDPPH